MADQSINIPQILAVALVGFLAIRWYMNKPTDPSGPPNNNNTSSAASRQVDVAKVEQVASMFPQLDRRSIAWDLQRNGGNVGATTERVLSGRALETPPPAFRPVLPAAPAAEGVTARQGRGSAAAAAAGSQPDLITRYNLQARVAGKGKEPVASEEQKRQGAGWSGDKSARAEGLRKRREEMILEARRKMLEKEQGEAA
ncbi:hypothetical protein MBLNU230_g3278t1 [Neophaeotheca triangularis]